MQQTIAPSVERALGVTPRVLVFFDYACQFCYLDWPRFKRLREEHGSELLLVPYELRPAMPAEGVSAEQLGGKHSAHVEQHMHRMAEEGNLELVFPDFVPNTHYALALGEYARDVGLEAQEAVHEAIFAAYSGRGDDIGREEVLLDIAETHAFDRGDVAAAFREGRYDARLHDYLELGQSMGITGTPAALICNELFIGTRPYGVLAESLERCLMTADKLRVGEQTCAAAEALADDGTCRPTTDDSEGAPPSISR